MNCILNLLWVFHVLIHVTPSSMSLLLTIGIHNLLSNWQDPQLCHMCFFQSLIDKSNFKLEVFIDLSFLTFLIFYNPIYHTRLTCMTFKFSRYQILHTEKLIIHDEISRNKHTASVL